MASPYLLAGAMYAEFSEVFIYGSTNFSNNIANQHGGDHGRGRFFLLYFFADLEVIATVCGGLALGTVNAIQSE